MLDDHPGSQAQLPWRTLAIAFMVIALQGTDRMHLRMAWRTMLAMCPKDRQRFGIEDDNGHMVTYRQVEHLFRRVRGAVEVMNPEHQDDDDPALAGWITRSILQSARPDDLAETNHKALDGTDIASWGVGRYVTRDGKTEITTPTEPCAGVGHRPPRNGIAGGVFCGYELHYLVDVPDDTTGRVPEMIASMSVVPAGTNRAVATMAMIRGYHERQPVNVLIVDRGYTMLVPESWSYRLDKLGIGQYMDLAQVQHKAGQYEGAIMLDGWLFSPSIPARLRTIAPHTAGMTTENRKKLAALYDERDRYAFRIHSAPDITNRTIRLVPPCRVGAVRCTLVPISMRKPAHDRPTVTPPDNPGICCQQGTLTVPLTVFRGLRQHNVRYGTTDWVRQYFRRVHVETVNSLLKTHYANGSRGFIRIRKGIGVALLLAFVSAAIMTTSARAWRREHGLAEPTPDETRATTQTIKWKPGQSRAADALKAIEPEPTE
jgi:hypothetical protein